MLVWRKIEQEGRNAMSVLLKLWKREDGQDMVEYALMAATIAVVIAGFLPPAVMPSVSSIFSKVCSSFAIS
jgi:Flp pilus assembly pilin Flp